MIYIENKSNDPCFNLALEEYLFNKMDSEEVFFLWKNNPTVVVGKYMNTIEEINAKYVKDNNVNVVRRLSGGGAVYHDLGNLNFTFIVNNQQVKAFDFRLFTKPIIEVLKKLDIKAEFNSRNDLTIEGKKFSGNSQYMRGNKILHHGTLLFDSNLDDVQKALMVSQDKYISKGIKSVRSRVTNISEHLVDKISIEEFEKTLLEHMKAEAGSFKKYELSEDDIEKVNEIKENKYIKWDWTYGESPKFNLKRERKFAAGKIQALIDVEEGMIQSLKLYGDFFGNGDLSEIENKFVGIKYEESHLQKIVEEIDVEKYIKGLTSKELISVIIG